MAEGRRLPRFVWRLLRIPPRLLYRLGLGPVIGRQVLLLTTTGRKSGLRRVTPLQYGERDGLIYIGAVRGEKADWFRNIQANPEVEVQVRHRRFRGLAEPVTDSGRIADFLEFRLQSNPRMIGALLRAAGLPASPTREDLERYVAGRAMAVIRPREVGS